MLLATFVFDKYGLRAGIVLGACFQGLGAAMKYFINQGFWTILLGQSFLGISQPFMLDSPALLATYWFEEELREIAITLGTSLNTCGIAVGYFLPTLFVDSDVVDYDRSRAEISNSLLTQGIIAVSLAILALFTFQNKPKIPPSSNAAVERDDALCRSYKQLLCNFEFLKLSLCFSLYFTNILVLSTLIDKIVEDYGFNTDDSGFFGTINIVGAFLGSVCTGMVLKYFKRYKIINVTIGLASMLAMTLFYFSLHTEKKWIVTLAYAFVGFCTFPTLNLSFAY